MKKSWLYLTLIASWLIVAGCRSSQLESATSPTSKPTEVSESAKPKFAAPWLGIHLFVQSDETADQLATVLPQLAQMGVNVLVVEVGYHFDFKSHPELRRGKFVTRDHAQKLAAVARENGIRLIPELDCLGHQSLKKSTLAFLATYPEFTEPSPSNPDPKTDYLKNWCPNDSRINPIVFDLIDEIADAFSADGFHVGMDEIFNLASDKCPLCHGQDPAQLFAKVVNEFYAHIAGERKMEMFMWGDRLLDAQQTGYSKWEASRIGTAGAIDLISTNIVICDWHYGRREIYPSVPLLLEKGFRVWPAGFRPLEAAKALSDYAKRERTPNPRLVGYLCTTWSLGKPLTVADWPPVRDVLQDWQPQTNSLPQAD